MKPKTLILVVLVVAIVSAGLWWFMQPESATSSKTADVVAPTPTNVNVTKPAPATTGLAAPIISPTAKPVQTPQAVVVTPAQNDTQAAQAELNVVFDDMATMMRSGDVMGMQLKYTPPDELRGIPPGKEAQAQAMQQVMQQMEADPRMKLIFEAQAQAVEFLKDQQPVLNAAGDEATYQMTTPAMTFPDGTSYPAQTETGAFKKVDGKWYIEDRAK